MASEQKTYIPRKADKTMLKVEDMTENHAYAFNLAPEIQFTGYDKKTRSNGYSYPHKTFRDYVQSHLMLCKYSNYELFFELSPLGRQHYHGMIIITDINGFFTKDIQILNSLGCYLCKIIDDKGGWLDYICKQQHIWSTKFNINTSVAKTNLIIEQ